MKGIANAATLANLAETRERPVHLTGEDLANVAVVPLQEDLTSLAALGIQHAERNGHHYFRGLDHLPDAEQTSALDRHADLYGRELDCGRVSITDGKMLTGSLACVGFGHEHDVAFDPGFQVTYGALVEAPGGVGKLHVLDARGNNLIRP